MKIKHLLFLTLLSLILFSICILPERPNQIQSRHANIDTSYYHVYLGMERGVIEEFIITYKLEGKVLANIKTINYLKYTYVNTPAVIVMRDSFELKEVVLTNAQIDTLNTFSKMITNRNVIYNFIAGAGRIGIYKTIINGDTTKFESKELYSLTDALGYERK